MSQAASVEVQAGPGRRGRPRDQRIDRDITSTALAVLSESGFDGFSVEEVAQRAGVAKTTVYRRFPTRTELIVGALERLNDDLPPVPPAGPVRGRLIDVLTGIRQRTPSSVRGRLLMRTAVEGFREPELADLVQARVLAPRRAILKEVLVDGIAAGELRADLDLDAVVPLLVGPMVYLGMWGSASPTRDVTVESVVDLLLSGLTRATDS